MLIHHVLKVLCAMLVLVACSFHAPAWYGLSDEAPPDLGGTSGSTSGTSNDAPPDSSSPDPGSSTTGGSASHGEGSSSEGAGDDGGKAVPVEVEISFLNPSPMIEVGEVQVSVWTSRPVASVDIFNGDAPLVLGAAPQNPVHVFEVTSDDVPGDGTHTIRAVAHAADGVSGEDVEALTIDVQPGGTDVWPPYVKAGPINGFTSAAIRGNGIDVAGYFETKDGLEAVAVRIDGTKGQPEGEPIELGSVAVTGGGRGPAIAVGDEDDAAFVAWTMPDSGSTRWAMSRVKFGEGKEPTTIGGLGSSVNAITVDGDVLILVGADEVNAGTHDLKVWWLSATGGQVLDEQTFAAPGEDDFFNEWDEVARGVAIVDGEIVVVGERQILGNNNQLVRRTIVLQYGLGGEPLAEWTSSGELLDEDAGMAVAPLHAGGFVVTGWGRDKGSIRQVLTRWFSAENETGTLRIEPTPSNDAIGFAIGEDREGKIVIAGALQQPKTDANAWIFAIPGPVGVPVWEVIRNGPGQGPDEAAGLALDAWGYAYVAGSEFDELQPRAFALRLYP
ncbi:hypothetical protein [Nannocystis punicea]|uniref:Uncharacterized protein n=1 Tax=Nannocystis punicea TaxID=2995304 RepID=A0ABY7H732_9BACT|nr:hypothetical protein [Nannocystis poenicansa]WAS95082.1 hypothetical protein O0S08_02885 [Nannocystis poenicansa]